MSLLTDRFQAQGIALGAVGHVIEVYDNGDYKVEFSGPDGVTYAEMTARAGDLTVDELAPASIAGAH